MPRAGWGKLRIANGEIKTEAFGPPFLFLHCFARSNDGVVVSCAATGFDVDWGDGAHTTTSSTGGPYPTGDVTHVYQQASTGLPLGVTEHWSCAWSDRVGDAGTIAGLTSVGHLTLEIREIQTPTASGT